ncbi:MAG: hypothetical protein AMXMBFR33_52360 [Candidatus Xenobia bacterium]
MTILDRMVLAVEKVRDRLLRASQALAAAGIGYAVVGGNAVAAWVAKVDAGGRTWISYSTERTWHRQLRP